MKSNLTCVAAGALAASLAFTAPASAVTFDFTFFVDGELEPRTPVPINPELVVLPDEDEVTQIIGIPLEPIGPLIPAGLVTGSGQMTYDGPAVEGVFNFMDLANLSLDFQIGDQTWDENDIVPAMPVFWNVIGFGDVHYGSFSANDVDVIGSEVIQVPAAPACDFVGSILLFNGSTCLTASPFGGIPAGFAVYAADGLLEETISVQAMPTFGQYIARTSVAAVPLPATLPLLAFAIGGMGYLRSRRS